MSGDNFFGAMIAKDCADRAAKKARDREAMRNRPRRWDGDGFSVKPFVPAAGPGMGELQAEVRAKRRMERAR